MTLRFWSDTISLERFVEALGYKIDHLYFKGEPMALGGVLAGRPATRHYASIANAKGHDVADIADWLTQMIAAVASDNQLVNLLHSGQIEALFWIALFGREPMPIPVLEASLVTAVADLGAKIFLENYTDLGPDGPTKIWLPAIPEPLPNRNVIDWHSAVPLEVFNRAYRESHGELAWARPDAVQVVKRLQDNGYHVVGVDIWIPTHPGPTIPTPFVYDWSEPAYQMSAVDFIETFEWDPTDRSHLGREPYFNLTVADT